MRPLIAGMLALVWAVLALSISGCDQIPGSAKYEMAVDKNGRTIRLDKRTGEITIIDGDKVISPKSAAESEMARSQEEAKLALAKKYSKKTIKHLYVDASLQTSWQNGKIYYYVQFNPLAPEKQSNSPAVSSDAKPANPNLIPFVAAVLRHDFYLHMQDVPFDLLRERLNYSYVAGDKGETTGFVAKGNAPMSKEAYLRLDEWNMQWQPKR